MAAVIERTREDALKDAREKLDDALAALRNAQAHLDRLVPAEVNQLTEDEQYIILRQAIDTAAYGSCAGTNATVYLREASKLKR